MAQKKNSTNQENNQEPTIPPRVKALASATLARLRLSESSDREDSSNTHRLPPAQSGRNSSGTPRR